MKNEKVKPIILTDNETGEKYTLEFNRESVLYAERNGFNIEEIDSLPMTRIPEFFYYAFRMHHKFIKREKTDEILFDKEKGLGGLPEGMLARLGELYAAPFNAFKRDEDNEGKNSRMTVEM